MTSSLIAGRTSLPVTRIFIPVRPFDHRVCSGPVARIFLSPEILPVLLVLAANVAISRVVIGMHFLSDVLVGSGAGALLGYVAFRLAV